MTPVSWLNPRDTEMSDDLFSTPCKKLSGIDPWNLFEARFNSLNCVKLENDGNFPSKVPFACLIERVVKSDNNISAAGK